MVTKLIKVFVKPGCRDAFLAAQEIWNREMARTEGFVDVLVGRNRREPDVVYIEAFWQTRQHLEKWMKEDHDRIAALAGSDAHYLRLEVTIIEPEPPPESSTDITSDRTS